jgi:hypothetical protein
MADHEAALAQFMDVTGASKEAAKFFLDSSGGVVDAAVDQFFATGGEFQAPEAAAEEDEEEFVDAQPELAAPAGACGRMPQLPTPRVSMLLQSRTRGSWHNLLATGS